MNVKIKLFAKSNFWVLPIFAVVLPLVNTFLAMEYIPSQQIAVVACLFAIYYILMYSIAGNIVSGNAARRITAIVALLLLFFASEKFIGILIYEYLPEWGIYMDKYMLRPDYKYNVLEFRRRWISAFLFVFALIVIRMGWRVLRQSFHNKMITEQQLLDMRQHLAHLSDLLRAKRLSPHFIENYVALALGREMTLPAKQNRDMILLLTELMYYQLEMDDQYQGTSWAKEREQVDKLLEMARIGNKVFCVELREGVVLSDRQIPHGLLLMPIENVLRYGKLTRQHPLRISFEQHQSQIRVRFQNSYDAALRKRMRSSGTGFNLMRARINGGNWPVTMKRNDDGKVFTVEIWIGKEEANV